MYAQGPREKLQEQLEVLTRELKITKLRLRQETQLRREIEAAMPAASRELDELVSVLCHDLGTPLAPVIGFADLYLKKWRDQGNQELLDLLKLMRDQANKALRMLRALGLYARTGYLKRPETPVDPTPALDEVLTGLSGELKNNGIEVTRENLPWICIPREYLKQIFQILFSNIIGHAGPQKGPVAVGGKTTAQGVQLYVRDHGDGLPDDLAENIFQIFPHHVADGQGKGSGIGLATLRKIAGFYGGRTWVEETAGGGCTFWVELAENCHPPESVAEGVGPGDGA